MENTPTKGNFSLEIFNQDWLGNEPEQFDLCSHGQLRLIIGDETILDGRETYGLSESALALLRTLERDHNPDSALAEKMIFHGCGTILMLGCPIGVDWSVRHTSGQVILSDVRRWDWPDEDRPTLFPGQQITLSEDSYRKVVIAFAEEVRQFFRGKEKVFIDETVELSYQKFWQEFDGRCE